jgi:flagellar protein FliL
MADEGDDLEEGMEDGEGGSKRLSGKKIVLFIVLPLLLLIGAGVGVTVMLGVFSPPPPPVENEAGGVPQPAEPEPAAQTTFFEVPDLIVNLNTDIRKSTFLKIKISLEIADSADTDVINQMLPRIVDNFQVYLRELRIQDLQGSAGMYRLREELLRRVNIAVRPARVKDVLFKEMLVQ